MIICPVAIEAGKGFAGKFQELEFLSLQGITAGTATAGMSTMCNGANMAFTRKAYELHAANLHPEMTPAMIYSCFTASRRIKMQK